MSFIQANLDKYTVKQMCSALKFPRSTYYAVLNHVPSKREQEYKEFSNEVLSIYNEFKKRYRAINIHRELNDRNIPCSVKRVQCHMKKLKIKSIVVKKYQYQKNQEMLHSFNRKGNPYDNACIESFNSVLKKEEVYTTTYYTFEKSKSALFEYIESFYNRKRRYNALDYKTPQQVEDEALAAYLVVISL